jgi:tetratricopeptide (TPR) repeat protein
VESDDCGLISASTSRGYVRQAKGDLDGTLADYEEAIRLRPHDAHAYYKRGELLKSRGRREMAITDYQKYLDLGGGVRNGDQAEVEQIIRDLREGKV